MKALFLSKGWMAALLILSLPGLSYSADELGNPTRVNDEEKTSSRIGDMITAAEQAKKAVDLYNAGAGAVDAVKNQEKLRQSMNWASAQDRLKNALKDNVVVYKSGKGGFNRWLNDILKKTSNALTAANKRVNMWRTTEPMLKYYGKRMVRMADNTVEVFLDFRPEDLVDIDREWSKNMEGQIAKDRATLRSFNYYLRSTAHDRALNERMFASLFFDDDMFQHLSRDERSLKALLEMKDPHGYRSVPFNTLGHCTEAINGLNTMAMKFHGPAAEDPQVTQEAYNFQQIQSLLQDPNQTMEDSKHLSALIERRRAEVAVANTEIEQVNALTQTKHARLLLRKTEDMANQHQGFFSSLQIISQGSGTFESVEEHRRKIFGTP